MADGSSSRQKEHNFFVFVHLALTWKKRSISTMATQTWAEEAWIGKWYTERKEAWLSQIREVQMWRQVRGPAGASGYQVAFFGTPCYLKVK